MATDLIAQKGWTDRGWALLPITPHESEALSGLPKGPLRTKASMIRNARYVPHHNWYWALARLIWENQSRYPTVENVSDVLKGMAGHVEVLVTPDGREMLRPKSINFGMPEDEFRQFTARLKPEVAKLLPGITNAQLEHELAGMIGIERRAA